MKGLGRYVPTRVFHSFHLQQAMGALNSKAGRGTVVGFKVDAKVPGTYVLAIVFHSSDLR
jgi:hypothetical protein